MIKVWEKVRDNMTFNSDYHIGHSDRTPANPECFSRSERELEIERVAEETRVPKVWDRYDMGRISHGREPLNRTFNRNRDYMSNHVSRTGSSGSSLSSEDDEAFRNQVEQAIINHPMAQPMMIKVGKNRVAGQEARKEDQVRGLSKRLADLVHRSLDNKVTVEMRGLAVAIIGLLGDGTGGDSKLGRAFAKDLVTGGRYLAKGWSIGEFEWTFLGGLPGDSARMSIRRDGKDLSVELLGDHGLAPYDAESQGTFWHPTNWTEGTGLSEGSGKRIAELIGRDTENLELPEEEELDGFC